MPKDLPTPSHAIRGRRETATDPADLTRLDTGQLAAALERGGCSSVEVTRAFLDRIDRFDGSLTFDGDPSRINAFVRVDREEALAGAETADRRRAADPDRTPPLCGIPIAVKDLFAVAGRPVTASSAVSAGDPVAADDSAAWATLRAQGLVHLGHVHTHEFAAGGTTDQVGNPWDLARSAGGSSGGSAAALAARLVPLSLGTDTMGSVRIPAALTGISAIKPTRGAISTRGVIPLAASLDTVGPMARTVADAALLFSALTGTAIPSAGRPGRRPLSGVRLALTRRIAPDRCDPDVLDGLATAIQAAVGLGAQVVELAAGPAADDAMAGVIVRYEMAAHHQRYADRRDRYRPIVRAQLDAIGSGPSAQEYGRAQERRRALTRAWDAWFADHHIDALLEPTVVMTAPLRAVPGSSVQDDPVVHQRLSEYPALWNLTGHPVVALPAGLGRRSALPVGVSLVGPTDRDTLLLQTALDLQADLGVLEPPLS